MKNKLAMAVVSLALLAMVSSAVFGYALLSPTRRWFPPLPITVRVDDGGLVSVNDGSNGVTRAVGAVNAWNGSGVTVTNGAAAPEDPSFYVNGDGQSDILFADPRHLCTGSCIAATLTGYYTTSQTVSCGGVTMARITDADVAFNLGFNYTTAGENDGCSNEIYLESVVTHEVGHVIGLAHSGVSAALMAPTVSYCVNKMLNSDDIAGRNALYNCTIGGGGCKPAGQSCTQNSDCCSSSCKGKPGSKTCR